MPRILIVEDHPEAQELIRRALRGQHDLTFADCAREGLELATACPPDLLILDAGLPDVDGFELCTQLRSNPILASVPIVFLTSRGGTSEKVMAFKLGADDYVQKPFEPAELQARIEARLRSAGKRDPQLRFSDLELDPIRQEVCLRLPDREWSCDLTPHEFRILHCLAVSRGIPVPRRQLMEAAWGGVSVSARTMDTHVSNMRKKLAPHGDRLEAVRGVGYRLAEPKDVRRGA